MYPNYVPLCKLNSWVYPSLSRRVGVARGTGVCHIYLCMERFDSERTTVNLKCVVCSFNFIRIIHNFHNFFYVVEIFLPHLSPTHLGYKCC